MIPTATARCTGAALALLSATACVFPAVPHRTGHALDAETVSGVRPGRTTKRELFALLGPPWGGGPRGPLRAAARWEAVTAPGSSAR